MTKKRWEAKLKEVAAPKDGNGCSVDAGICETVVPEASTSMNDEQDYKNAVLRILSYRPGFLPKTEFSEDFYQNGDENAPFFSEVYLYNLLGKEEARTLLALMRPVWKKAGIPREQQP